MAKFVLLPRPIRQVTTVVVSGGRDFDDRTFIYLTLNELLDRYGFSYLVEGDGQGLDKIAGLWARKALGNAANRKYPADWDNVEAPGAVVRKRRDGQAYNLLAGFWRNQQMLDEEKPDLALIFPGNSGTKDMFDRVRKAGVPYITIPYDKPYSGMKFDQPIATQRKVVARNS